MENTTEILVIEEFTKMRIRKLCGKNIDPCLFQAKFIPLNGNLFLILTTFHGVQIHSANDQRLVYFHPLSPDPNKPGESHKLGNQFYLSGH